MVAIRPLLLVLLMFAAIAPASASAAATTRIIVEREPGLTRAERADVRQDAGVRLVDTLSLPRTEVVSAPAGEASQALRELNADHDVIYAELDRTRRALTNDDYYRYLWALDNGGQWIPPSERDGAYIRGTADADMDVPEAWGLSTGSQQTVVVVDSGVDASHPDLSGQILTGGHDWVDDDATPQDADGHGTNVTGTIVAKRDNAEGVVGVAPNAKVLPLRVLGANAAGTASDVAEAFDWAGDHGMRIVNASLGSTGYSATERAAMAAHPETLYVVAAGNGGNDDVGDDVDASPIYPCAYNLANIVCVGASDPDDQPAGFSNHGVTSVDLFAPGVRITSTQAGAYYVSDGTSMASPYVAAEAALIRSRNPGLTAAALKAAILGNVDAKAALDGLAVTGGRANAFAAVNSVPADPHATPPRIATDIDNDNVPDVPDNCDAVKNPTQADADRDGIGDACDPTPRGPDADHDGKPALDDKCPAAYGTQANGCPAAVKASPADSDHDGRLDSADRCRTEPAATPDGCPLPYVTALSTKGRKRAATIKVHTSRPATAEVTVQRKRGRRWVSVTRTVRPSSRNRVTLKLKRLRKGRYRAVVVVSSAAGRAAATTKRFKVR
jgi:thermitase